MSGYGKPRGSKFWQKHGCEHSEMGFVSAIYCSNTSSVTLRATPFSLWLGHARVLTALRAVIHSPHAASLPTGEGWRKSLLSSAHKLPHARQPYYAGVQTMRARICSASSCAMFARVVWLKLRRVNKLPTFALPFASRTRHALLPATNSCTPHGGSEGGRRESSLLTFGTFGHAKVQ